MNSRRRWLRRTVWAAAALLILCLGAVSVSALYNRTLPDASAAAQRLSDAEKARLAEVFQLRETLGNDVWPGWGDAALPLIVYNESYAFLVGYPDPPAGWRSVPDLNTHGRPWEAVAADDFRGATYYRQKLLDDGPTPQAFTVLVGDRWVGSMQTWEWLQISFREQLRGELPGPLGAIAPYGILLDLFIDGSDMYLSLVAHELFHAYQGIHAPDHLAAAETSMAVESRYPWQTPGLAEAWQSELDLLVAALEAENEDQLTMLARQFLDQRDARRAAAALDLDAVDYERQREWLEGLGRYAELEIWRLAAAGPYEPLPAIVASDDFASYRAFDRRWSREVDQIPRMASDEGEGRFYYTGMAQAVLLDRLEANWKSKALRPDAALEDLLRQALDEN